MSSLTEEEIFDKSINDIVEDKPKKPKRKLTEKQLENLKKGREKMAEKRKKDKEEKAKAEKDAKAHQEHQDTKAKGVRKKRATIKDINKRKELAILENLQKQDKVRTDKRDLYETLKVRCLETAKTVKEFNEIKDALSGINDEILNDKEALKEYCKKVIKPYITKKI